MARDNQPLHRLEALDACADAEAAWRQSVKLLARAKGVGVDFAELELACEQIHEQARAAATR
jgi:phage terminase small subunit